MEGLSDMTLDKFKLWSSNALKVYLSSRKKNVDGTFEELAARAFCAWEEKIQVDEKAEQIELRLLNEYKTKLRSDNDIMPDPFSLSSGWKGEKSGMDMWPSVYVTDIATYLNCNTPGEVVKRVLNEYKEGKAYRYFDCGWVKEVFYHDIRRKSDKCFLKAKVTPSQSVNNKNYDVWVAVKKKSSSASGGEIIAGYCTCTAGMHGTCNHIAGLLFRVEYAVKTGLTNSTCTEKLCQWNVPKNKTVIKPVRVTSVSWRKSDFLQGKSKTTEDECAKKTFTPLSKKQCEEVKDDTNMRQKLYEIFKDEVPSSVFVMTVEKKRPASEKSHRCEMPPSLISAAKEVGHLGTDEERKEEFYKALQLTEGEIDTINQYTIEQSSSSVWKEQRKGRITASNFHRVCSRVNSLKKDPSGDTSALVKTILGECYTKQTLAMKHGLSMEPFAKKAYVKLMRKQHKKFKASNTGLSVFKEEQYIAASADVEVECDCCGKGLCEIKCPESIKGSVPSETNVPYIKKIENNYVLDKSHPYYYQIQGQMGILGRKYCDLFVYTFHGNITVRITFDMEFWKVILEKLTWFWKTYVYKALMSQAPIIVETKQDKATNKENQIPTQLKTPRYGNSQTKYCVQTSPKSPKVPVGQSPLSPKVPSQPKECPKSQKDSLNQCPPSKNMFLKQCQLSHQVSDQQCPKSMNMSSQYRLKSPNVSEQHCLQSQNVSSEHCPLSLKVSDHHCPHSSHVSDEHCPTSLKVSKQHCPQSSDVSDEHCPPSLKVSEQHCPQSPNVSDEHCPPSLKVSEQHCPQSPNVSDEHCPPSLKVSDQHCPQAPNVSDEHCPPTLKVSEQHCPQAPNVSDEHWPPSLKVSVQHCPHSPNVSDEHCAPSLKVSVQHCPQAPNVSDEHCPPSLKVSDQHCPPSLEVSVQHCPQSPNVSDEHCPPSLKVSDQHCPQSPNVSDEHCPPSLKVSDQHCHQSPKILNPRVRRALDLHTPKPRKGRKIRKMKVNKKQPLYLCGTCGLDCVDEPQSDSEQSVNCDLCDVWVHYTCAGVDDKVSDMTEWMCAKCRN